MFTNRSLRAAGWLVVLMALGIAFPVAAEGEPDGTFPTWEERWIHQLINRARCDPEVELAACASCPDDPCYSPITPLPWTSNLNRAARFHSDNLTFSGCGMQHNSPCTLITNIGDLYPETCDGDVSCACEPDTLVCGSLETTPFSTRITYFGAIPHGEIIAPRADPTTTFYLWLHEPATDSTCTFTFDKGHRWLILKADGAVGIGAEGDYCTGNFGAGLLTAKIPSGSHYPEQASSVELWANWYDGSGPLTAAVNVEGVCHTMTLERGSSGNGAWMVEVDGVGSGCHRYYFEFSDSVGTPVTYPTTGSLAIGSGGSCPDWHSSRPGPCVSSGSPIFADGFESGSTSLWSDTVPSP